MSEQPHSLTFWNLRDERDCPLLLELNRSSRRADGDPGPITLEIIADALAHMDGLTQEQGVIIASVGLPRDKPSRRGQARSPHHPTPMRTSKTPPNQKRPADLRPAGRFLLKSLAYL